MKLVLLVAFVFGMVTSADARPVAYVDEVVVAGGPALASARELTRAIVESAGMEVRFADPDAAPCGDDPRCLASRADAIGAVVALRLTFVEVAGQLAIAMLVTDRGTGARRQLVERADPVRPDPVLAATLRELVPEPASPRRTAMWAFTIATVGLAATGVAATWYAYDLRDQFFAEHVDANGDVFGISPAGARAEERRARRWSLVGGLAFGAAGLAGVTATLLFVRSPAGESRPAGVAVTMELP